MRRRTAWAIRSVFLHITLWLYLEATGILKYVLLFVLVSTLLSLGMRVTQGVSGRPAPLAIATLDIQVVVEQVGPRPIEVVKVLRDYFDIEARSLLEDLERPPVVVGSVSSEAEGRDLVERLAGLDTSVSLIHPNSD